VRRALAVLLLVSLPEVAQACAVCAAAAADRNNAAFIRITILLSSLPLAMIAAGLWWIARRARVELAGEFSEREAPVGVPGAPVGGGDG